MNHYKNKYVLQRQIVALLSYLLICYSAAGQSCNYQKFGSSDGLPTSEFYDVIQDSNGLLWFTSDKGVVRYDYYEFKTFTQEDGLSNLVNFTFFKEDEVRFWLTAIDGTFSFWDGSKFTPFRFNEELKRFKTTAFQWFEIIEIEDGYLKFIPTNSKQIEVYQISLTNGEIFTSSQEDVKLSKCNPKVKRQFLIYQNYLNCSFKDYKNTIDRAAFPKEKLQFISKSKPGRICNEAEIGNNYYVLTDYGIEKYTNHDFQNPESLLHEEIVITSLIELPSGDLWATSQSDGIIHIPNQKVKHFNLGSKSKSNFYASHSTDDFLFLKSVDDDIFIIDTLLDYKSFKTSTKLGLLIKEPKSDSLTYFQNLIFDTNRKVGHGPLKNLNLPHGFGIQHNPPKIQLYDKNNAKIKEYRLKPLSFNVINNNIYIGCYDGLYLLKINIKEPEKFTRLLKIEGIDIRINDIAHGIDGLWLATHERLLFYDLNTQKVTDSINFNLPIMSIFEENDSLLWLGTNRGLKRVDISRKIDGIYDIQHYTIANGLSSNYIKQVDKWRDNFITVSDQGINYFKAEDLTKNKVPSQIYNIEITSKSADFDRPISNIFQPNDNDILINYLGICEYKDPALAFYRYQLNKKKGTNSYWIETNSRKLDLYNLAHGKYWFYLQSRNGDGSWGEMKQKHFKVLPKLVDNAWFRWLVFLLIITSLFVLYKWKNQARRQQHILDLTIKDLKLEVLRNQINPHFIFNSLNSIQKYIFSDRKIEANRYIHKFSSLIRKSLLFTASDKIILADEITFMEEYLSLESKRFSNKFDYEITCNDEHKANHIQVPPLIIQPLIENCIKHAFKNIEYQGMISIQYDISKYFLIITVKDNGIGLEGAIKTNNKHRSLGLTIVHKRISIINKKSENSMAKFSMSNSKPTGTICKVQLPLNTGENENINH